MLFTNWYIAEYLISSHATKSTFLLDNIHPQIQSTTIGSFIDAHGI